MKIRIKYISPASLAATLAVFYFTLGLFVGLFGVLAAASGSDFTLSGPVSFSGSGKEMLPYAVAYPFLASIVGAISGFIIAWIYNFASKPTKGILIDVEKITPRGNP